MIIQDLKKDLIEAGLGDNINLALLIYLAASVRVMPQKISILVTGPAGAGKSFLVESVLKLIPEEDILAASKMTPVALVRQGDLSKKILYIYERVKDAQLEQYTRELISEGEVLYFTAKTGGAGVNEYRLKGPTTFIQTTVNPNIVGIENKSRCFVVDINTSEEARRNIHERQKTLRTIEGSHNIRTMSGIQRRHKEFQKRLDASIDVWIPYAERIRFHSFVQHSSRILSRILNVITAIAFLEQSSRQVKEEGGRKYIEAVEDDFNTARDILQALPIDESESVLPDDTLAFTEILRHYREALSRSGRFTRSHIFDIIEKSHYPHKSSKVVIKHLSILSQIGYIDEMPVRGLKNRCEYSFGTRFPVPASDKLSSNCYETLSLA